MTDLYPFKTTGFKMDEKPDCFEAECLFCDYSIQFGTNATPGEIGTDLLLHRLKCETGSVDGEFVFAADTWDPQKESWLYYEIRIRCAFAEALHSSSIKQIPFVHKAGTYGQAL